MRPSIYISGIWYSLPIQLVLLHFKRYQILLVFWYILFATVNGSFMHQFGAHMLFLYPEYLDKVSGLSLALVGAAVAIFIMSWNITTFILHGKHIKFLATTTQPFLKYCMNNAVIPLTFLLFYFFKALQYDRFQELLPVGQIFWLAGGFLAGFVIALALGFTYFFGADKTIYRRMAPDVKEHLLRHKNRFERKNIRRDKTVIRVDWYISATFKIRRPRSVRHYTDDFIERIFKQHHLAALFSVLVAFISLIIVGYFLDNVYFQIPAAASVTVFFAILIAVAGALAYFLQSWSLLFVLVMLGGLNFLYKKNIFDPRNKAFGLTYSKGKKSLPEYNQSALLKLAVADSVSVDSLVFIRTLERWKARQNSDTPALCIVSVSGGGNRAAVFTTNVLLALDSLTDGGLMPSTFLISGASGGMMGAAWYRELYLRKMHGLITSENMVKYADVMAGDLLNPLFTSLVARDLIAPPQRFTYKNNRYTKDRGYAFEQRLNANTFGWMDKSLQDYKQVEDSAQIPRLLINAVITRDGRKLIMGTRPMRFMMQSLPDTFTTKISDPDAVDFSSYFAKLQPDKLSILSALRMNATFPYVLPNVWLPTNPIIDVMDAGFRDNTGLDGALKFLYYFRSWLKANTAKVVLIQIRDKQQGGWDTPYESNNMLDVFTKPALLTQNNLFRFQEYAQLQSVDWFHSIYGAPFHRVVFEYKPINKDAAASLSFHLTQREKMDLKASLKNKENSDAFKKTQELLKH
jgi:hypothetical protein